MTLTFEPKNHNIYFHQISMHLNFDQNPKRYTWVIVRKPFLTKWLLVTLTFDLLTQKQSQPSFPSRQYAYQVWSKSKKMHLSYRPETIFDKVAAGDLDLWPFDPKSNPNLPFHPDNMSTKFHQNPKKMHLSYRPETTCGDGQTDRQTDGQTWWLQYPFGQIGRGGKNYNIIKVNLFI